MLAGRLPFQGKSALDLIFQHAYEATPPLASVARGVPAGVAAVVDRLLAKDPGKRFARCAAVREALAALSSRREGGGENSPVARGKNRLAELAGLIAEGEVVRERLTTQGRQVEDPVLTTKLEAQASEQEQQLEALRQERQRVAADAAQREASVSRLLRGIVAGMALVVVVGILVAADAAGLHLFKYARETSLGRLMSGWVLGHPELIITGFLLLVIALANPLLEFLRWTIQCVTAVSPLRSIIREEWQSRAGAGLLGVGLLILALQRFNTELETGVVLVLVAVIVMWVLKPYEAETVAGVTALLREPPALLIITGFLLLVGPALILIGRWVSGLVLGVAVGVVASVVCGALALLRKGSKSAAQDVRQAQRSRVVGWLRDWLTLRRVGQIMAGFGLVVWILAHFNTFPADDVLTLQGPTSRPAFVLAGDLTASGPDDLERLQRSGALAGFDGTFTGIAVKNSGGPGVALVCVSLFDGTNYWNGKAFASRTPVFHRATLTGEKWSCPLRVVTNLAEGKRYTVNTRAIDWLGNRESPGYVQSFQPIAFTGGPGAWIRLSPAATITRPSRSP
jgi:hypothetical protein